MLNPRPQVTSPSLEPGLAQGRVPARVGLGTRDAEAALDLRYGQAGFETACLGDGRARLVEVAERRGVQGEVQLAPDVVRACSNQAARSVERCLVTSGLPVGHPHVVPGEWYQLPLRVQPLDVLDRRDAAFGITRQQLGPTEPHPRIRHARVQVDGLPGCGRSVSKVSAQEIRATERPLGNRVMWIQRDRATGGLERARMFSSGASVDAR